MPFFAAIFSPTARDPRLDGLPINLEPNPYLYGTNEPSLINRVNKALSVDAHIDSNNVSSSGVYSNVIKPTKMSAGKTYFFLYSVASNVSI